MNRDAEGEEEEENVADEVKGLCCVLMIASVSFCNVDCDVNLVVTQSHGVQRKIDKTPLLHKKSNNYKNFARAEWELQVQVQV